MDHQILIPSPPIDFHFESTSTSPYTTAPSSPKSFFPKFYYSAPASPTSSLYDGSPINSHAADGFHSTDQNHEQKKEDYEEDDADFAFDFSGQLERPSISDADELFHGGKIKPLEPHPPPLLQPPTYIEKNFKTPLRERTTTTTTTKHRKSESLSPMMRVSDILSDHQKVSTSQSPFNFMWYNKWNLKNLLLFRSTSEGSAATSNDGDTLKGYAMITKGDQLDSKNSSFRSCDGGGSVDGSSSKRRMIRRKVSAHEIHYTANRAVAEEMKKKTFLPYRSGLLGCLGFSHSLHEISRGRR